MATCCGGRGAPGTWLAETREGSFNWMSRVVSWVGASGCAAAEGTGITAAIDAFALTSMSRVASEENHAQTTATAEAATVASRIFVEIENRRGSRIGESYSNSAGSGSPSGSLRKSGTESFD